jgi:hypothetical protein
VRLPGGRLTIDQSVIGTLNVEHPGCDSSRARSGFIVECPENPLSLRIRDSIVHASQGRAAITGECCWPAHAELSIQRSTVLGDVWIQQFADAEDSLFVGLVHAARRALGYMRYCYVPPNPDHIGHNCGANAVLSHAPPPDRLKASCCLPGESASGKEQAARTPPRFRCVPDSLSDASCAPEDCGCGPFTANSSVAVAPKFVTLEFGRPGYCELAIDCPPAIRRGAQDESELGVYHDNYWPQREALLAAEVQAYTPADITSAVILADDLMAPLSECCYPNSC